MQRNLTQNLAVHRLPLSPGAHMAVDVANTSVYVYDIRINVK